MDHDKHRHSDNLTEVALIAELWRRRVEWMWTHWNAEYAPEKIDIEWLDQEIAKDEEASRAR